MLLVVGLWASIAPASAGAVEGVRGPLEEIAHPTYRDANGTVLDWGDVREIARRSDAIRRVRRRRLGRTVLRTVFAGATAVEAWGTWRLAQQRNYLALPLGAQAASSGIVTVLLFTSAPQAVREDRAIVLRGANQVLGSR